MNAKILTGVFTFLATSSLLASNGVKPRPAPVSKTITYQQKISRVVAKGNFEIVLIPDHSDRITIEGDKSPADQVEAVFKNGKLSVYDNRTHKTNVIRIYIAARELTHLYVYGHGSVTSSGKLISSLSQILLDGEIEVRVNATPRANVVTGHDYDLIPGK